MVKKLVVILVALILIMSLNGCQKKEEEISQWSDIYIEVFESLMTNDKALNDEMKYIAINGESLANATTEDLEEVEEYFEKYEVDVVDESYQSLKDKGMVIDDMYIEGVLLEVSEVQIKSTSKVIMQASKYRSGTGAIGMRFTIEKQDGKWTITKTDMEWVS